jgi:tRNA A-37 threonylcarbamoyl transferase component Bud32
MSPSTTNLTAREERADAVIAAYCKAVEEGQPPDQTAFLASHPDVAPELKAFFADQARFHAVAQHLAPPAPPAVGTAVKYLGDYELLEIIAQGGMGVVYKARQTSLKRMVALKMILAGHFASPEAVQRFRTEAEAAAKLDHPHIVPIYEVGAFDGQHYFTMKLIDGNSLAVWRGQAPTKEEIRRRMPLLVTVAQAVHHAHQRGILHRDLKPANILVDREGKPHVTDFGLAKQFGGTAQTQTADSITHTGAILGTPSYMAPEQASGSKDVTTLADVYSLGAILYEALTGRPPFQGANVFDLLQQVVEVAPLPPSNLNPAVDRDLEAVCLKCLAKEPGQRYATAAALAEDLTHWLAGEPLSVQPPSAARLAWQWLGRNIKAAAWLVLLSIAAGALPMVTIVIFAGGFVLTQATKSVLQLPGENTSSLAYVNWRDVMGFLQNPWWYPLHLVTMALPFLFGLLATRLVRTRSAWGDLNTGLGAGLIAGLTAFVIGIAPAMVLALTTVPQLLDLHDVCEGSFHTDPVVGPPLHPADRLYARYPGLRQIPTHERGGTLFAKLLGEQVFGTVTAIWVGAVLSLLIYVTVTIYQCLVAGWLWRRGGSWWTITLIYLECTAPFLLFLWTGWGNWWGVTDPMAFHICLVLGLWACLAWLMHYYGLPVQRRWPLYVSLLCPGVAVDTLLRSVGADEHAGTMPAVSAGWALSALFVTVLLWEWRRKDRRHQKPLAATHEQATTVAYEGATPPPPV